MNHKTELSNIKNYTQNESDRGKRVLCLYRVSTDKQVTYNDKAEADIPMQRQTCRRFLEQQGWVLVHEEREDGISGHKVRAEKRDSIQNIKKLALAKEFDILLVFMFDRIGRIADETPFVVEWLIKHDIRVWSVNEGEQRLDSHTDKLTNYIRFWQADGESEKTSMRTSAGLGLLVESGHFKGGTPPFGYALVKSGRLDKKGNEKKNLAVLEDEAIIVRKIYDLYVQHGYGVHKIANVLAKDNSKTRAGKNFQHTTINHMLKNLTYTGVLRSGKSRSKEIKELQIIAPHIFEKAQDIMKQRNKDAADKRTYPMNTESRCLLNGKIYCADCGSRLVTSANGKYIYVDGIKMSKLRYICYGRSRKLTDCKGQYGYTAQKLDNVVDEVVKRIFSQMKSIPKDEVITSSLAVVEEENACRYKSAERDYLKISADLAELKAEVLNAIRGKSKFTSELLNELISETEKHLTEIELTRNNAKQEVDNCKHRMVEMQAKYDEVISWTELYEAADLSAKKMIIANLINRIEVGTNYSIHIDFNIDLEHLGIKFDSCISAHEKTA